MKSNIKLKLLSVFSVIAILVIAGQGYYNWKLSRQVAELKADRDPFSNLLSGKSLDPGFPDLGNFPRTQSLSDVQKRLNDMMDGLSSGAGFFAGSAASPQIEMKDKGDAYQVTVDVPEGQEVEINTKVDDNRLEVSGKVKSSSDGSSNKRFSRSSSVSRFSQSLYLPEPIDQNAMVTKQDGNKIIITLPKG